MRLLLDTHIILWALDDNPKLPEQAKTLIMDAGKEFQEAAPDDVEKIYWMCLK